MAEIILKSPHFKQRDIDTVKFDALVTVGNICGCLANTIDIPGLTVASTAATTFTIAGFEAESDVSLDAGRRAGITIKATGTVGGASDAEIGSLTIVSAIVSGSAGSRLIAVTIDSAANAITLASDSLTNAVMEISLPIKSKDF